MASKPPALMKPLAHRQQLGKIGEILAARYLQNHGYRLLARNFKARWGELDIVALQAQTLVFVEVKTRIGRAFGTPQEAVTPWKLREVIRTAQFYKSLHPKLPESMRIDVIGVELNFDYTLKFFHHLPNVTL